VTSIFVNKQLFVRNHSVEYVILSFSGKLQQVIKLRHSDTDGGGSTKNDPLCSWSIVNISLVPFYRNSANSWQYDSIYSLHI
jgi:hypothetical protein